MGLLDPPSSHHQSPALTHPTPSPDGAYIAPDRTSRAHCWRARDQFFACLDAHGIVDSVKRQADASRHCESEDQALRRECAMSWVTYFKQRRVMEYNKKQTLERLAREGGKPAPEGLLAGREVTGVEGRVE